MKVRYILFYSISASILIISGCSAPKVTVKEDLLKPKMPAKYIADTIVSKHDSIVPWRQLFTDPNLVSLIDSALANNQDLMMTLQQIEIARSNVMYQKGRLLPTVTAGLGVGVEKVGRYTSTGAGNATTEIKPGKAMPDPLMNYQGGVQADWEVDLWHKLSSQSKAATEQYLATIEGKNAVLSTLIADVAGNYFDLLCYDNQLDLIHQYIDLQQKAVEIAKIQKEADVDTELAVQKFNAELAKAKSTEYILRQQVTETENNINLLLGRFPSPIVRDMASFMTTNPPVVKVGIPSELLLNRPDIRQAEHQLAAANWNVESARKEFLPSLNISASLGLESFNPTYLTKLPESLAFSVLGGLTGPLINKKAIEANFHNATAQQLEALYNYDKTLLTGYIEVCNLMAKIQNMDSYLGYKKQESDTLDKSIEIARQLYQNGRVSYLDVLMDQRDALDAKMELLEAKGQQLSSVVNIYKSIGGGWK